MCAVGGSTYNNRKRKILVKIHFVCGGLLDIFGGSTGCDSVTSS